MKNVYVKSICTIIVGFVFSIIVQSQTKEQEQKIISRYDLNQLDELQQRFNSSFQSKKIQIENYVVKAPETRRFVDKNGSLYELQRVEADGTPIYYKTFNVGAAKSTRTNFLHSGGGLGLNLMGQNMTAYVWDGGHARTTHQEYDGAGGTDRVTLMDTSSEGGVQLHYHAAHVTGTIVASGVNANAKGMAPQGKVKAYMWNNDLSEATSAAANGMLISNHSYGYASTDQYGNLILPNYYPGAYIADSRDWDQLMYNAPNYLMVVAAGNDGGMAITNSPLDGQTGYDKLTGHTTSKNNLVVANANDASIDSNGNLTSVTINS